MLDDEPTGGEQTGMTPADAAAENTTAVRRTRRRTTKAAVPPDGTPAPADGSAVPADSGGQADPGAVPTEAGIPADTAQPAPRTRRRKAAAATAPAAPLEGDVSKPAASTGEGDTATAATAEPASAPVKKVTRTRRKKATAAEAGTGPQSATTAETGAAPAAAPAATTLEPAPAEPAGTRADTAAAVPDTVPFSGVDTPPVTTRSRRTRRKAADATAAAAEAPPEGATAPQAEAGDEDARGRRQPVAATVLFVAPSVEEAAQAEAAESGRSRRRRSRRAEAVVEPEPVAEEETEESVEDEDEDAAGEEARRRRRRGRRGRGRGKGTADEGEDGTEEDTGAEASGEDEEEAGEALTRRRRRRRRRGAAEEEGSDEDGVPTVVRIREPRPARDQVQGVSGSTRLEAKRQRRRDGREQRRTRPPILSEAEFLARREAVDRMMVVRQRGDRTQIAVLEDKILVEHYVTRSSSGSMVGNVHLGKVQNVLPSMEAAFVDVGRGRNAVLYAGEVNWDATGLEGRARSIEQALRSGDPVLVQVTKDPIGHKGARLTSHVALSGRHLVYVPNGNASGISRKLPDTERKRLRDILKKLVPDGAGVIVRTAAEGASEDDLARDVKRLQAQWEDIQAKAAESSAPALLYEEPDLVIRVVRDLFNEDFRELVVQGDDAYETVEPYLSHVSPDLVERLHRYTGTGDVFAQYRIDEQILKGLDRKVYLPSGGHLVIDRTEAMTVIDVNTGKYTGAGGNLEETVTRNNLEAAEEIVRQLRLRDLGGIIVIDFIDMVLESNRELVLRRLTECLGRDRTKHQVTEITSLGLVQMTRKRIGQGLLEAFSETCEHCKGRGLIMHTEPVPEKKPSRGGDSASSDGDGGSSRRRGRRGRGGGEAAAEVDEVDEAAIGIGPDADETPDDLAAENGAAVADGRVPDDAVDVEPDEPDEAGADEERLALSGGGHRRGRRGGSRRRR